MNKTNHTVVSAKSIMQRSRVNGGQSSHLSKPLKSDAKIETGSVPKSSKGLLLTREMAAERLGCHWQTVIYREKKGDLTGIKIANRKFYALEEVEKLLRSKPVRNKPHWSKQPSGGPGSGQILIGNQPAVIVRTQPEQPVSLWNKIKSFLSAFIAK